MKRTPPITNTYRTNRGPFMGLLLYLVFYVIIKFMSEFSRFNRTAVALGAGFAIAVQPACSQADALPFDRCYSAPQPGPTVEPPTFNEERPEFDPPAVDDPAWDAYYDQHIAATTAYEQRYSQWQALSNPEDLTITIDAISAGGRAKEAPVIDTALVSRVEDGIVQVTISEIGIFGSSEEVSKGTGFVTTDEAGRQLVVTAAHVLGTAAMDQVAVTTDGRQTAAVIDGCVINERDGQFMPLDAEDKLADTDIAVIVLAVPLAVEPLVLAEAIPQRGEWGLAVNYQDWHEPGYAASYPAMVATVPPYDTLQAVTGLQAFGPETTNGDVESSNALPGASGGPLVNSRGEVIGATVLATRMNRYISPDELTYSHDVRLVGPDVGLPADQSGLYPRSITLMDTDIIRAALNSPRLDG